MKIKEKKDKFSRIEIIVFVEKEEIRKALPRPIFESAVFSRAVFILHDTQ